MRLRTIQWRLQFMRLSDETIDAIYYRMYGISDEATAAGEPKNEIWSDVVRDIVWGEKLNG